MSLKGLLRDTIGGLFTVKDPAGGSTTVGGPLAITGRGGIGVTVESGGIVITDVTGQQTARNDAGGIAAAAGFALREIKFFVSVADFPAGFYLCDGSNGTPDLITNNPFLTMNGSAGAIAGFTDPAPLSLSVSVADHTLVSICADGVNTAIATIDGKSTGSVSHAVTASGSVSGANIKAALHEYNLIPAMYLG